MQLRQLIWILEKPRILQWRYLFSTIYIRPYYRYTRTSNLGSWNGDHLDIGKCHNVHQEIHGEFWCNGEPGSARAHLRSDSDSETAATAAVLRRVRPCCAVDFLCRFEKAHNWSDSFVSCEWNYAQNSPYQESSHENLLL